MKKRNTAIRALSVFLAYAMVCTSVPAAGQEMFGSGVDRETEENTSDLKEFQSSQADDLEQIRDRMQNCSEAMMQNRSFRMEKTQKRVQTESGILRAVR